MESVLGKNQTMQPFQPDVKPFQIWFILNITTGESEGLLKGLLNTEPAWFEVPQCLSKERNVKRLERVSIIAVNLVKPSLSSGQMPDWLTIGEIRPSGQYLA